MTATISTIGASVSTLSCGWTLTVTPPGQFSHPADLPDTLENLPAAVPGTVAAAMEEAGRFDRANPSSLENCDAWYRLTIQEEAGPAILRFEGLATVADVFLNGQVILHSESMFESHDVPVILSGDDRLAIRFQALEPHLQRKGPRARWRPRMMRSQGLRLLRTTALGFMPGWCPDIIALGPWRPVQLIRPGKREIFDLRLASQLDADGTGHLCLSFHCEELVGQASLLCAGQEIAVHRQADGRFFAELLIPDVQAWWPHTHGDPVLHDVVLKLDGFCHSLAKTGFRRIKIDRGPDGKDFALIVNGQRIFCRGAVWTTSDIVSLAGERHRYEPWLKQAAEAGMNMVRIGGTMTYETPDFFRLCDELGIMIWQDMMLANFDYPAQDEPLMIHVKTELTQLLHQNSASPSFAVLCGGSEMFQQGAMLGLPERIWKTPLTEDIIPQIVASEASHLAYVANSPSGGAQPFFPNEGVGHYYGVGAYMRPLEDARRVNLRFAAECLAFSNVPEPETLQADLPFSPVHDPRWKARVPRDAAASWDFEDVREHYMAMLYGIDLQRLRRENPDRYLAFARATTAEVVEQTFGEWRRPGSTCNGALVWTLQDLLPGPGWGVIDARGRPKSVWYAMKRAFRPLQLLFSDEGTNGLLVHLVNETLRTEELVLEVTCLRNGKVPVVSGRRELTLAPRSSATLAATDLFGAFFDTTYAYRFGPPAHDVTIGRITRASSGEHLADAFYFPQGRTPALHDAKVDLTLTRLEERDWAIDLATDHLAQNVHLTCPGFHVEQNYFHLAPQMPLRLILRASNAAESAILPSGTVTHLASSTTLNF